nr:putative ribonuclease H-like domain-containing protein [Tanacetum cinerariifolium]
MEAGGVHKGYDRMQKILSQLNPLNVKPDVVEINPRFLRALPSSWFQVALTLKTKGGLEFLSFDNLYYKLKTLEMDIKGYRPSLQANLLAQAILLFLVPPVLTKSCHMVIVQIILQLLPTLSHQTLRLDAEEINLRFLRALPSSWFQVALTLKTKGGLEFISFDDLYYKVKTLEMDIKGYSTFSPSQSTGPSHTAFVSTTSTNKKLSYGDSPNHSSTTTYSVPSNSRIGSHRIDLEQIEKLDMEEMDLKWQMAMLSVRVHKFEQKARRKINFDKKESTRFNKEKEIGRKEEDSKALVSVDTLVDWSNHKNESDEVIAAKEFGMIAGANFEEANTPDDAGEFALMGVNSERTSSKNLYRLIDSSMSVRTKVGLGFTDCISQKELGWDDYAFCVFTTTSEDVEGRPTFHRFAKTDSMKAVPPPLTGDYTYLSDHTDLDESQMFYGTKSSTSNDFEFVPNDFVSCDDNDKSSEDNTSDFASRDSSGKSSKHKLTEIESNVGTPIIEPISVKEPQPVPTDNLMVKPVPTGQPKVKPVPTGRPKVRSVPTGKPQVTLLVPAGRPYRPFPVPTDRGYSPSVMSGWWSHTPSPIHHFTDPTSSYFQTYTPYLPTMYYNNMQYGGDSWATAIKPSAAFHGGKVTFGGREGRITGKGTIHTPTLDFENVYYVKELQQFNLFSISQICDKKNQVLFTDTECLVLSKDFKLPDDSMVVLKVLRKHNLYTINLNDLCPKGKQHKSTYKAIHAESSISKPLQLLHMDLFGPTLIKSIDHKYYCLVITDDYSRFCWVFFLEHKDETYSTLKSFITLVENQLNKMVKAIRCDNGTEFKNAQMIELCRTKRIRREYSNKAYRVYNVPNKRVEETMNLYFLKDKPNVQGLGHEWYFDLDYLTDSLGTQDADSDSGCDEQVIIELAKLKYQEQQVTTDAEELRTPTGVKDVLPSCIPISTGIVPVPTGSLPVATGSVPVPASDTTVPTDDVLVHTGNTTDSMFDGKPTTRFPYPSDLGNHNPLTGIFSSSSNDDEFDITLNNVDSSVQVSLVPTKRIHTIHPQSLIIGYPTSVVQTRTQALADPSWVDAMKEEMQQFKFQNVWVLVELPPGKYAIGNKWILKNKRDARGIVIRNKARLVAQGHRQEECIDYDKVFAPIARIEAIRLFLAFASYMGFLVYQMDVKSAFLYGKIEEEVYVTQPKGFVDPHHPTKVYKVVKALYGLHQAPRAWTATTPYEAPKPKSKSENDSPINVHLYRSMIVKKIFKYLKGQPKLGLWYPKESPLVLEAYSDSDYAGANKDRKSTTGGCQFLVPTGQPKVKPVPTGRPKVNPVHTAKLKVRSVPTGKPKVSTPVPTGKPKVSTPVPTGKPKVSTPVPAGRLNRPFPSGYSPSVSSDW